MNFYLPVDLTALLPGFVKELCGSFQKCCWLGHFPNYCNFGVPGLVVSHRLQNGNRLKDATTEVMI